MKKPDSFLLLNLLIVFALGYVYYYANTDLSYFENNNELKAKYERNKSLKKLDRDLKALKKYQKRNVAAVPTEVDASMVGQSAIDNSELARKYFLRTEETCYQADKVECLNNIDLLVSQFPESIWAAESLVILTEIYVKSNRSQQARQIINILKNEFKDYKAVQAKVNYLEKNTAL